MHAHFLQQHFPGGDLPVNMLSIKVNMFRLVHLLSKEAMYNKELVVSRRGKEPSLHDVSLFDKPLKTRENIDVLMPYWTLCLFSLRKTDF